MYGNDPQQPFYTADFIVVRPSCSTAAGTQSWPATSGGSLVETGRRAQDQYDSLVAQLRFEHMRALLDAIKFKTNCLGHVAPDLRMDEHLRLPLERPLRRPVLRLATQWRPMYARRVHRPIRSRPGRRRRATTVV